MQEGYEKYVMPFGCLNLYSRKGIDVEGVIRSGSCKKLFNNEIYNVMCGYDINNIEQTYRTTQMKRGVYLGHNVGNSCELSIVKNDIYIKAENPGDYKKIFWSFILKYIFTKASLEKREY